MIWEGPVVKKLSGEEVGETDGHDNGIYVPKAVQDFFGKAYREGSKHHIKTIVVDLFRDNEHISTKLIGVRKYKNGQTRLRGTFSILKELDVRSGDMILFWRNRDNRNHYKVQIVRSESEKWYSIKEDKLFDSSSGKLNREMPSHMYKSPKKYSVIAR